jgi:very-short-patch-repair endonuclease
MDPGRLRRIARRQYGLFHRDQAYECGYTPRQVRRRVDDGEWRRVVGPVLAAGETPITMGMIDRAAQLSVRDSVLAGPSAAVYHGMIVPRSQPVLIVGRRVRRPAGVTVIVEQLDRRDIQVVEGLMITSPERTLLDCALLLPEGSALDLVDRALQQRMATVAGLVERTRARVGRPGAPRLARLVGKVAAGTRSAAERRLGALLRRDGLTGWTANEVISDERGVIGVGDVVFRAQRLVVEADGFAFHVTPEQFQRDRARQNRLITAGWRVLRFTWRDLVERPNYVIQTIRRIIAGDQPRRSPSR